MIASNVTPGELEPRIASRMQDTSLAQATRSLREPQGGAAVGGYAPSPLPLGAASRVCPHKEKERQSGGRRKRCG